MRIARFVTTAVALVCFCNFVVAQSAGPFTGTFSNEKLTVDWTQTSDGCTGTISLGTQQFPSTAKVSGQTVEGTFTAAGRQFPFAATLDGDTLRFNTAGTTYVLQRQATVANPLAGNDAASKPADAGSGLPDGYTIVASTDAGRSLSAHKNQAASLSDALSATLPDLSKYFDAKPTVIRAYQDSQNQSAGGYSFTDKLKGQSVNGLVSCKLNSTQNEHSAAIAVLYCKSDATAADWNKLTTAGAGGASAAAGASAGTAGGAAALPPLHEYDFPDGTGSIGLADGWTTKATSCHGIVVITGPADQAVTLGFTASVLTPDSQMVRTQEQLNANAQRMGGRPMQMNMLIAPYDDPVSALKNLMPQLSAMNVRSGAPSLTLDNVGPGKSIPSCLPNGRAAVVNYGLTLNTHGEKRHHHVLAQVEIDPVANGTFMFCFCAAAGPDASFPHDVPVMLSMMQSMHENAAVIQQQTRQQIDQMNQRFAAQQAAQKQVQSGYDDYNKGIARDSVIQSRSNDDFDEVIRGVRTVQDTQTGDKSSVNLGDVNQIVDNLNTGQPGRYVQIPLRDEADPLPSGR